MLKMLLNKVKNSFKAVFYDPTITIKELKHIKYVYLIILIIILLKTSNLFIFIILNLSIDLIISALFLMVKISFKKELVLEKKILTIKNSGFFDKTLRSSTAPNNFKIPFLLGFDGKNHIYADLSKFIHVLIAGSSGKGKSNFINQLLQSILFLSHGNIALFLCDMKRIELCHDYKHFPNCVTFYDPETLLNIVTNIREEMQERYIKMENVEIGQKAYKNIEDYNLYNPELPYICLLIDEFGDLGYIKNESTKSLIWDEIKHILREGRAAGIFIILATQRPTKENIKPDIKALMTSFIGFGVSNNNESYYCGVQGSADLPIGEFIVNSEKFSNTKMKSYLIQQQDKIYYELVNSIVKEKEKICLIKK